MDPKELFARMKQFAQEQEAQAAPHLNRIDNQFKLQPGYTQGMLEDMASASGGVKSLNNPEMQAAVNEFQQLKKAIQDRGYGRQLTEEELINSYPKDTLSDAEKLIRRRNVDIDVIDLIQDAEKKKKHPGSEDITKIIGE
jgi:hypothetical protein